MNIYFMTDTPKMYIDLTKIFYGKVYPAFQIYAGYTHWDRMDF